MTKTQTKTNKPKKKQKQTKKTNPIKNKPKKKKQHKTKEKKTSKRSPPMPLAAPDRRPSLLAVANALGLGLELGVGGRVRRRWKPRNGKKNPGKTGFFGYFRDLPYRKWPWDWGFLVWFLSLIFLRFSKAKTFYI